jgi:predicted ATP-dependent protease
MLDTRVIDAVTEGRFHIYAISTIDEALSLLTGLDAGVQNTLSQYPAESVNGRVAAKVEAWIAAAKKYAAHDKGDEDGDE